MENAEKVWDAVERHHVCMLVDKDGKGLRARPMAPYADRGEGTILFVTDARNAKDDEIRANPEVCLTFADGHKFFLSVSGRAEVVKDSAKLKQIWSTYMEAFFPDGPDSPNAILLRVRPTRAEFWESDGKIVSAVKALAAVVGQKRPHMGDNEKVAM